MTASDRQRNAGLDGLRGLAVLFVLFEHFTYNDWFRSWDWGSTGVRVFFVLSGFLITGILLDLRARYAPLDAARRFFTRRMLRLGPAFLLAITLALGLGVGGMAADWPWHLASLSNVHVWRQESWSDAGHFWTLALEQQFYLLWFPVVVLLPRRWLLPLVLAIVIAAPLCRMTIVAGANPFRDVLLPAQGDALGAGALLCLAFREDRLAACRAWLSDPRVRIGVICLVVAVSALNPLGLPRPMLLGWVVLPVLKSLAAMTVIAGAVQGARDLRLLTARPLVWLGTVSYGLYVYHYFVPQAVARYIPALAEPEGAGEKLLRLAVWLTLALGMAAASWYLVERPFLSRPARRLAPAP